MLFLTVAGVMICMSVSELIPVSLKHAGARNTALSIVAGFTAFAMLELFFEQQ
jgi:zinc transporter ZupT